MRYWASSSFVWIGLERKGVVYAKEDMMARGAMVKRPPSVHRA